MISPFEDLPIDRDLVCEFFGTFARFEYALKATKFCAKGRYGIATPDWKGFQLEIGQALTQCDHPGSQEAIRFLLDHPPQVQKYEHGHAEFRPCDLAGNNEGEKAIEAARRVRNNLFHGGKHTPHSPPGLDEALLKHSLIVLQACLSLHAGVKSEFEHQLA